MHFRKLLNEWAVRRNRPSRRPVDAARFLGLFTDARGRGTPLTTVPALSADLLIIVTTYARPRACTDVLERLERAVRYGDTRRHAAILVLHDSCDQDYEPARQALAASRIPGVWLDARQRLTKVRFWETYQTAFLFAEAWQPTHALFVHDDIELAPDFFEHVEAMWTATSDDARRRVLYLYASSADEVDGRWIRFPRRELPHKHCRQRPG